MLPNASATTIRRGLAGLTTLLLCAGAEASVKFQSLDAVRAAVSDYIQREYRDQDTISAIEISQLDPRLNLPACPRPLEVFPLNGRQRLGNATFGVRCNGERPWTLYVPVRITRTVTVLAAAVPLARGTVLKASDLKPIQQDAGSLPHGYFTRLEDLVGMELRRPLQAGAVITHAAVTAAAVIERGQEVLLVADNGAVAVSMKGEALESGAPGERIQVRNLSSRRIVQGEVIDRHRVRVAL